MSESLLHSESGGDMAATAVNNLSSEVGDDDNSSKSNAETEWDNPSLLRAFDSSKMSDVVMTFLKDRQLFASKAVLASFSCFFHNRFLWNCRHQLLKNAEIMDGKHRLIIDMSMYDYDVVYHLVRFFYGAPVSSIPAASLVSTIRLADEWMVPSFKLSLKPELMSGLNDEEVLLLLDQAEKNGIAEFVEELLGGIQSLWSRLDKGSLSRVPMSTMRRMIRDVTVIDLDVVLVAIENCRAHSCKDLMELCDSFSPYIEKRLHRIPPMEMKKVLEPTGAISADMLLAYYRKVALDLIVEDLRREFAVGKRCSVLQTDGRWSTATVRKVEGEGYSCRLFICYRSSSEDCKEWIEIHSNRLATLISRY